MESISVFLVILAIVGTVGLVAGTVVGLFQWNPAQPFRLRACNSTNIIRLRVMSHNIRYAATELATGEKPWPVRLPLLASQFVYHSKLAPNCFICLQEVLHHQLTDLLASLNASVRAMQARLPQAFDLRFTVAPLKFATYIGLTVAVLAMVYGSIIVLRTLIFGSSVPGYPSLMAVILFIGGAQLVTLGIIGEYLGRVFNETKVRPLYLVERHLEARLSLEPPSQQDPSP